VRPNTLNGDGVAFGQQTRQSRLAAFLGAWPMNASPPRRAEPMNPPDILGDDIIVISGWAARSPRAAAPSSPGSMPRMALALADASIRVNRSRLNELAARTRLHALHVTPPEQEIAWIKAIPEAQVKLPIIVCIVEATRP
jgi:hypothetical protein